MITYQSIYKYDYVDKSTNIWMNENNEQSCLVALVKVLTTITNSNTGFLITITSNINSKN
jgi:hypothetical protein